MQNIPNERLDAFLHYKYKSSLDDFREDFIPRATKYFDTAAAEDLEEDTQLSDPADLANRLWDRMRRSLANDARFSRHSALDVEQIYGMREGALTEAVRFRRAFVLVDCHGPIKKQLAESFKRFQIVQSISIVSGSTDLILRLHGPRKEIDSFVLNEIYSGDVKPTRTTTCYTMFDGTDDGTNWGHWSKLPATTHPEYDPYLEFFPESSTPER